MLAAASIVGGFSSMGPLHAAVANARIGANVRIRFIRDIYFKEYRLTTINHRLKLKLQLFCGEEIAFGPGKAELLEAIGETGSISAAARTMGMSYRRAWLLVDAMNRCFRRPLVETVTGSGAQVTREGEAMLAAYRAMCEGAERGAGAAGLITLTAGLRSRPEIVESR